MRTPAAILVAATLVLGAGCGPTGPTGPVTSHTPAGVPDADAPSPTVDVVAVADEAALGRWRRAPVVPSPAMGQAAETACRALDGLGALPLRLMDARGEGLLTLVFADDARTMVCHAAANADGTATADARAIEGLADAAAPADGQLGAYDLELLETGAGARYVIVGRVADVPEVSISFDDASWARATLADGWYTAWWSQAALALVVASVDRRNVVIDSFGLVP